MSILYNVIPRKNPQKEDATPLFYLHSLKRGYIDFESLVMLACKDSTIDPDELRLGLNRAFNKAEEYLSQSFTVSFGQLGYSHVTLSSIGVPTEEEATPAKLKKIRPHFVFGKKIQENLQRAGLEKKAE